MCVCVCVCMRVFWVRSVVASQGFCKGVIGNMSERPGGPNSGFDITLPSAVGPSVPLGVGVKGTLDYLGSQH